MIDKLRLILDEIRNPVKRQAAYYYAALLCTRKEGALTRDHLERILTKRFGVKSPLVYQVIEYTREIAGGALGSDIDTISSKKYEILKELLDNDK